MKPFFLSLALLLCITAQGQMVKFNKSFGGPNEDQGRCAIQTLDKGYIAAGATSTYSAGGMDVWLVKTDSMGMHQWSKNYGGLNSDWAWSIVQLPDSGYAVAGYTNSFGNGGYDMYLLRVDKSGDEMWYKTYGGADWDFAYSLLATTDGGFMLAGSTASYGAGNDDAYLVKTDANGDTLWTKTYGGPGEETARSAWQNTDGGYFITGSTTTWGNGGYDVYYIRTDAAGIPVWEKTVGGVRDEEGFSGIQSAMDGGFVMVGYTRSFFFPDSTETGYIIRATSTGDTIFTSYIYPNQPGYTTRMHSIVETPDYNLAMLGIWEHQGQTDVYFYKSGPYFAYINGTTHGYYQENDAGYTVRACADGGYIIAGATESFGQGLFDLYIVKTDSIGLSSVYNSIVQHTGTGEKLKVFPNPVTDEAKILLPSRTLHGAIMLTITDVTGRIVKSLATEASAGSITFNRGDLSPGAYFFTLYEKSSNSIIGTGKMLVQ